ncbi:MAG: D-2-hydroxyacid dehydrogenase [Woeseiaceae bacterium]|nr:D-2-hydroxyacid dehydrogenase [Woeseiaceae bacterium]
MKAAFLDYASMGPDLDLAPLETQFSDLAIYGDTTDAEIAERIRGVEFVFTNKIRLTEELIAEAGSLRFIGLTATGTDNIDLDTAKAHGIAVANIRGYCTQSVVEHVFGTLLMLTHSLPAYRAAVRAGEWQGSDDFCLLSHPVRELSAMTLGVVGYGELGRGVAQAAEFFGMQVLVSARPGADEVPGGRVAFDDLLGACDVITLHCPLTPATRGLFDTATIGRMKAGAILINAARGAIVDSAALVAALEDGHLAGASIDVLAQEPPVDGDPLLDYAGENLVLTPHVAWATNEARQNAIDELAANARAFIAGQSRNRVV